LSNQMKAILYTRYGSPEVLSVGECEKPTVKPDELLIRVQAAEATKSDCEMRSFHFAVAWFYLPLRIALGWTKPKNPILGGYFAGEVVSMGEDVKDFSLGDRVFGSAGFGMGAYGQFLALSDASSIAPIPSNLSFEEAAAVPLGGFNALHYLRRANIQKGDRVLVNGAGASIGTFAVQIAKLMGAEVTAVDSAIKETMLREIGADHFVDYASEDFTQSDEFYDVIFSVVAGASYAGCIKRLKPKGCYLLANPRMSDMLRSIFTTKFTDKSVLFAFAGEKKEELLALKEMIEAGEIKPVIDKVYSMAEAQEAHRRVEAELRIGSTVISLQ